MCECATYGVPSMRTSGWWAHIRRPVCCHLTKIFADRVFFFIFHVKKCTASCTSASRYHCAGCWSRICSLEWARMRNNRFVIYTGARCGLAQCPTINFMKVFFFLSSFSLDCRRFDVAILCYYVAYIPSMCRGYMRPSKQTEMDRNGMKYGNWLSDHTNVHFILKQRAPTQHSTPMTAIFPPHICLFWLAQPPLIFIRAVVCCVLSYFTYCLSSVCILYCLIALDSVQGWMQHGIRRQCDWIGFGMSRIWSKILFVDHTISRKHTHSADTCALKRNGKMASLSTKGFGFNVIESLPWFFVFRFSSFVF